jgi:predicted RNA binding protein YcfA (HicA-like mRNA interferase family)
MSKSYTRDVKAILEENGCYLARQGRGDHEIWRSPYAEKPFTVDSAIKSRHLANAVLKQAGLKKLF